MRARLAFLALFAAFAAACATMQGKPAAPGEEGAQTISAFYPEGPLWQGERLYYAEMGADRVSMYENGRRRTFTEQLGCGPTAIAPYGQGFLILCTIGARVIEVDRNGDFVRGWDHDDQGRALQDPNDGYADGHGGVYFSDPGIFSRDTSPQGYVMHLDAAGRLVRVQGPMWYPNGIYVDQPRHLVYVDEHMAGKVWVFDEGPHDTLTSKRLFVDINQVQRPQRYDTPYEETGPDGLEMGPDGDMWIAIYGEGRILRFSPQAQLVGMIELPTRYSTNIAFNSHGDAATTGSFENLVPPFPGQVRFHPAASLTRTAH